VIKIENICAKVKGSNKSTGKIYVMRRFMNWTLVRRYNSNKEGKWDWLYIWYALMDHKYLENSIQKSCGKEKPSEK